MTNEFKSKPILLIQEYKCTVGRHPDKTKVFIRKIFYLKWKNSKFKQEKAHTIRNKYQNTDINHTKRMKPHAHTSTHTYIRAHKLSHSYKTSICKTTGKKYETNSKERVTLIVPPWNGQCQNHQWGILSSKVEKTVFAHAQYWFCSEGVK